MPPPALPRPPVKALAEPTTFLSKNPVLHTWQGTKLPPRMPMKKRSARRPLALVTAPANAVGMAPKRRQPANVYRGPNRSQAGPANRRTRRLLYVISHIESIFDVSSPRYENDLRCSQSNDIRIRHIVLGQVQILSDRDTHLAGSYVRCKKNDRYCGGRRSHVLPMVEKHT